MSVKKTSRFQHLESVKDDLHTLIFYEAPHKLLSTLEDMSKVLGARQVSICRELTKLHEEVIRTTLPKAAEYYRQVTPKGEFVLVIEGAKPEEHPLSFEDALELARGLIAGGTGISQAAKEASRETGFKKGTCTRHCWVNKQRLKMGRPAYDAVRGPFCCPRLKTREERTWLF